MEASVYYLDGPGEVMIVATDFDFANPDPNKIISISTAKHATLSATATMDKVTGGRSLFARRQIKTEQGATFEMQDCQMDFRYLSMTSGEDITKGASTGWAFGDDYRFSIPTADAYTVSLPDAPIDGTLIIRFADGTLGKKAETTPSAAGEYTVSAKVLTFGVADKGKDIEVIYQYATSANTLSTGLKGSSVPKTVKIMYTQPAFDADNNIIGHEQFELYKVQPNPEFERAFEEKQAYAPTLKFDLTDPKRADGKIYDYHYIPKV